MAGLDILLDATDEPVSIELAKRQCRIDEDDTGDDEYLEQVVIPGAREYAELHTARSFRPRKFREYFDGFPGTLAALQYGCGVDLGSAHRFKSMPHRRFELSRSPLVSIEQIQYLDQAGATQTLDPSFYVAAKHHDPAAIYRATNRSSWPVPQDRVDSVWVDYTAGYRDPTAEGQEAYKTLPAMTLQAQLLLIAHWYVNRLPVGASNLGELDFTITNLLDKMRVYYQA